MCGIYGLIQREGGIDPQRLVLQRDRMTHRGPDDAGIWLSPDARVGLAHRRLSILDLSAAGRQPMTTADGRATIVFNGELYNCRELRAELERRGRVFQTGTDTEVLLAAWQQWGDACLPRFNGMFAFALFDAGDARTPPSLFLARDRAGKKPLYYAFDGRRLEFASELKGISARGKMSLTALNHYLAFGYVPQELCIVEGVKKLPPAYAARLENSSFAFKTWRYWDLPENRPDPGSDGESLATETGRLIEDSTRLRMRADVPVGILLSGGLDSSLVVAAAARVSERPIQTFTIKLPGSKLDESNHAKLVSTHFGTRHHELAIIESGLSALDELSPLIDEPLADSSLVPTFLISRLTRQHVTVALGGDGGDELFGGYGHYAACLADENRLGWAPKPFLSLAGAMASRLPAGVYGRNRLASLAEGPLQQRAVGTPYFDTYLRRRLFSTQALTELGQNVGAPERFLSDLLQVGADPLDRMTRTDFQSILPDDYMVKVDRASMAVSLEMRSPLLDYRLIEFAFGRIPSSWKVRGSETRRVEKILARRWLPPALDIGRKQGFSIPLDDWLRQAPTSWHDAWLARLPVMIQKDQAVDLLNGLRKGRTNGARIFALAMLGLSCANLEI